MKVEVGKKPVALNVNRESQKAETYLEKRRRPEPQVVWIQKFPPALLSYISLSS